MSTATKRSRARRNAVKEIPWTSWEVLPALLRDGLSDSQRLEVLAKLGSCSTVRRVDTRDVSGCRLSGQEWEALLRPLKSNPILEEINLCLQSSFLSDLWYSIPRLWGEVLENVSSVKKLEICDCSKYEQGDVDPLVLFLEQVALGERSSDSALQELRIVFRVGYDRRSFTVVHIENMIRLRLRELSLTRFPRLERTEVQDLSSALKQCPSLRTLEIRDVEDGMTQVLLQGFTGMGANQTLEELLLWGRCRQELGFALPELLRANISRVQICVCDSALPSVEWNDEPRVHSLHSFERFPWREIGLALLQPAGLKRFTVLIRCGSQLTLSSPEQNWVEEVWGASEQSPLLYISLYWRQSRGGHAEDYPIARLRLICLRNADLDLGFPDRDGLPFSEEVMRTLNSNQTMETCSIGFVRLVGGSSSDKMKEKRSLVLKSLCDNTSIKVLTLKPSFFYDVTEEDFRDLMGVLHKNFALRQVNVQCDGWIHDGKAALVQEAIERNVAQAQFISDVREAGLHFSTIRAGRIFLCGSSLAGKTQLKTTMLHTVNTRCTDSIFGEVLRRLGPWIGAELSRTEGIEIMTLRDDEEMNITVWDMGGQWIFRALQDLLFPRAGQACIYVFVFNPLERKNGRLCKKANLPSTFRSELKSWLRFIASNSLTAADLQPQMVVVLSHKDKMQHYERDLSWAREIVDYLRTTFEGVVDLSSGEEVHFINCFDSREVRVVTEFLFQRMGSIFGKLMGKDLVPSSGIELTSVFTRKPSNITNRPVWHSTDLDKYICNKSIGGLNPHTETGKRVLHRLTQYLQEVGTIIMIPDSELVVVDPNWITEKFLGKLISRGHDFRIHGYRNSSVGDGFVDSHIFSNMLSTILETYSGEGIQVRREHLEELLVKFDLYFELNTDHEHGARRYFMPIICGEMEETLPVTKRHWKPSDREGLRYFGFRFQCQDTEKTCLTKSFFPMFQIKLMQKLKMINVTCMKCSRGLLEIVEDEHEILVECDELGEDHIDIMVRSSKSKEEAVTFVEQKIIDFLHTFAAREMGHLGVILSLHILRTECVTNLTRLDYRRSDQAISVGDLKVILETVGKKRLCWPRNKRTPIDVWMDSCLQDSHWWPPIVVPDHPDECLGSGWEHVRELLPSAALEDIIAKLKESVCMLTLKDRTSKCEVIQLNDYVFEIHAPLEGSPSVELVFVHGICAFGKDERPYLTTWSIRDRGYKCWLNDWLVSQTEVDLSSARVLTVTYDFTVRKPHNEGDLDSFLIAENLTHSLITLANVGQHHCPVVLVGHCLGGLLIKELCIQVSRNIEAENFDADKCTNFLINVKGVFFYATPHLGWSSELVDHLLRLSSVSSGWVELLGDLLEKSSGGSSATGTLQLLHHMIRLSSGSPSSGIKKGDMMETMDLWNEDTSRLNSHFSNLSAKYCWRTRGVGESNKTNFSSEGIECVRTEIVVTEASARLESSDGFYVIQDTDHFTICRPEKKTSDNFLHLVSFIKSLISKVNNSSNLQCHIA